MPWHNARDHCLRYVQTSHGLNIATLPLRHLPPGNVKDLFLLYSMMDPQKKAALCLPPPPVRLG